MVAPRALVVPLLVKGKEASGNEIAELTDQYTKSRNILHKEKHNQSVLTFN